MDICTVVFQEELDTLRLQARSLELYAQDLNPRSIYVMVNDDSVIDTTMYGNLADRVRVIPRSIYGCAWSDNGWLSQQVLKLYGAALGSDTWCMILDAKTLFVRPVILDEIIVDAKPQVGRLPIHPVFSRSHEIAQELFGVKFNFQLGPGGVPHIVHSASVRAMISEIEIMTGHHFAEWFQAQGMLTEFILYSAYILHKYQDLDYLYGTTAKLSCLNICHSETTNFDRLFRSIPAFNPLTVSVHRRAWSALRPEQRAAWLKLLADRKII